jgi:hypothetical protein
MLVHEEVAWWISFVKAGKKGEAVPNWNELPTGDL